MEGSAALTEGEKEELSLVFFSVEAAHCLYHKGVLSLTCLVASWWTTPDRAITIDNW